MRLKKKQPASSNPTPFLEEVRALLQLGYGQSIETASPREKWVCAIQALRLHRHPPGTELRGAATPAVKVHYFLDPFDPFSLATQAVLSPKLEESLGAEFGTLGFSVDEFNHYTRRQTGRLSETEQYWVDRIEALATQPEAFDIATLCPRYRVSALAPLDAEHPNLCPEQIDAKFAPLLMQAPETTETVLWGGRTRHFFDTTGKYSVRWEGADVIRGQPRPLDWTAPAYPAHRPVTFWESAAPTADAAARPGHDPAALELTQIAPDSLTHWADDGNLERSPRHLMRAHFLFSAGLQKILRQAWAETPSAAGLAEHQFVFCAPAAGLGLAELLRLLLDEYHLTWEDAWDLLQKTTRVFQLDAPGEHPPRLPVKMLETGLPRHLEIIYEANRRHLEKVSAVFRGDLHQLRRLSVIEEGSDKKLRLDHWLFLAAGSCVMPSTFETDPDPTWVRLFPGRFQFISPGAQPPLASPHPNPNLAALITDAIGPDWRTQPEALAHLGKFARDRGFQEAWMAIKADHKNQAARDLQPLLKCAIDPASLWEVYPASFRLNNRHLLLLLNILDRYLQLRENLDFAPPPRTVFLLGTFDPREPAEFALVKLAQHLQQLINSDPLTTDRLRLFTVLNPPVEAADSLTRAATQCDILWAPGHETFSTAWIRHLFNGAWILTSKARHLSSFSGPLGTLTFGGGSGPNNKGYSVRTGAAAAEPLRTLLDNLNRGLFPAGQTVFKPLMKHLFDAHDPYQVLGDFAAFAERQKDIDQLFGGPDHGWPLMLNQMAQGAERLYRAATRTDDEKEMSA